MHHEMIKEEIELLSHIEDIGLLRGPLLVFGGVYSNLQALEALREVAAGLGLPPSQIICTGDVVAYCAQPEACVQAIRDWGVHCIAGNVEVQLRERQDDCACDFVSGGRCEGFSQTWYPYARAHVSEAALAWMRSLPDILTFTYAGQRAAVLHGSFRHRSEYLFASTPWPVKAANFAATGAELILAGHCGLPFCQQQDGKTWLNAGAIGMPANDGTPRVWFALLNDAPALSGVLQPLDYDYTTAAQLMEAAGLPPEYALTLRTGWWDNCEILPSTEAQMKGKELVPFRYGLSSKTTIP